MTDGARDRRAIRIDDNGAEPASRSGLPAMTLRTSSCARRAEWLGRWLEMIVPSTCEVLVRFLRPGSWDMAAVRIRGLASWCGGGLMPGEVCRALN